MNSLPSHIFLFSLVLMTKCLFPHKAHICLTPHNSFMILVWLAKALLNQPYFFWFFHDILTLINQSYNLLLLLLAPFFPSNSLFLFADLNHFLSSFNSKPKLCVPISTLLLVLTQGWIGQSQFTLKKLSSNFISPF